MAISFTQALNKSPVRAFQLITVVTCMLILVGDGMDLQLLGVVAPLVMEAFDVERGTFGIAMGSALVGFGIGGWAGGWMGDNLGRRWTLAISALVFSLATIGAAYSDNVWSMAFWRLLGGLGFGGAYANALTQASEWMPERWRPITVSTLAVGTPIGGTVAGSIGPDIAAVSGWEGTFLFFGAVSFLICVLILAILRDSPSWLMGHGRKEEAEAVASKLLGEPVELLPDSHETDIADGPKIGVLHASNTRLNIGIAIAFAAATFVAYGILSWSTTFLTTKGYTLEQAGNVVAVAGITSMIGSVLAGIVVRRFGSRIVMTLLSLTLVALMIALGLAVEGLSAEPTAAERTAVMALTGASGATFSASIASMYVMMALGYTQSCRSAGIGFGIFASRAGAIGVTAGGGLILQMGGTSVVPYFATLTVAAALVMAAALIVDRHVPPAKSA